MWGGQGLLGASVRFCNFEGANENVWHVLVRLVHTEQPTLCFLPYNGIVCLFTIFECVNVYPFYFIVILFYV